MAKYKPEYLARMDMTKENDRKNYEEGLINFAKEKDESINGKFITVKEYAAKYNLNPRTVQLWCQDGRIEGAFKFGTSWAIPEGIPRPMDGRVKNGEWVGYRKRSKEKN